MATLRNAPDEEISRRNAVVKIRSSYPRCSAQLVQQVLSKNNWDQNKTNQFLGMLQKKFEEKKSKSVEVAPNVAKRESKGKEVARKVKIPSEKKVIAKTGSELQNKQSSIEKPTNKSEIQNKRRNKVRSKATGAQTGSKEANERIKKIKNSSLCLKKRPCDAQLQQCYSIISQFKDAKDRVLACARNGIKVLVIMRGCSGSGKTTFAQKILADLDALTASHLLVSADNFFVDTTTKEYNFNDRYIPAAHLWCQRLVQLLALEGRSPIIVDNTHTRVWEMKNVATIAVANGYVVETIEPKTPWFFVEDQLFKKTVHKVSRLGIKNMLERYEADISGSELLEKLGLSYGVKKTPPKKQCAPLLQPASKKYNLLFNFRTVDESKLPVRPQQETKPSDNSGVPSGGIPPLFSILQKQSKPAPATVNAPEIADLLSFSESEVLHKTTDTKVPTSNYIDDLLDLDFSKEVPLTATGSDSDDSGSSSSSDDDEDDDDRSVDDISSEASSFTTATSDVLSIESNNPGEEFDDYIKTYLANEGLIVAEERNKFSAGKTYSVNPLPGFGQTSLIGKAPPNNGTPQKVSNSGTNTNYVDFESLKSINSSSGGESTKKIIQGKLDRFVSGKNTSPQAMPSKLKLDKGMMTVDINAGSKVDKDSGLQSLRAMFPTAEKESLEELFERCQKNLDWAVNVLLDCGHEISDSYVPLSNVKVIKEPVIEDALGTVTNPLLEPDPKASPNDVPKKPKKNKNKAKASPTSQELAKQLEKNIVLNESCYSDRLKKVRDTKHGVPQSQSVGATEVKNQEPEEVDSNKSFSENPNEDMSVVMDSNFIEQLNSKFGGGLGNLTGEGVIVQLPLHLARQLYSYAMDAVYQQLEEEMQLMDLIMKEDEELAMKFEKEQSQEKSIPSLAEVMNMELELRKSQKLNTSSNESTIASKLSKQLLLERFPRMDPNTLSAILEDTNHSLHQATTLLTLAGHTPNSIKSKEVSDEQLSSSVSKEDSIEQAKAYKDVSEKLYELRKQCLDKAEKTYRKGDKSVALFYSQMGQWYMERIRETNTLAAKAMVGSHDDLSTIDLHFLLVAEAVNVLDLFLDENIRQMNLSNERKKVIYIVTGRGAHSSLGISKIKPAVQSRLVKRVVRFDEANPGMLRAVITKKSLMSYALNSG